MIDFPAAFFSYAVVDDGEYVQGTPLRPAVAGNNYRKRLDRKCNRINCLFPTFFRRMMPRRYPRVALFLQKHYI